MNDDSFRWALVSLAVLFMPVGLYHRVKSYTGERLDRWQEGACILVGLRLVGLATVVVGISWMIDPSGLAWTSLPLPSGLRWTGMVLAASGGTLFSWAVHHLGRNLTDTVVTRQQHTLVTTGPYRFVRHPFYVAVTLGVVGCSLAMANWLFAICGGIGLGFLVARTQIEEQKLVERFGDDYRAYMQHVGRFCPRLR